MKATHKILSLAWVLLALGLLCGCAGTLSEAMVSIDLGIPATTLSAPAPRAEIEIVDLRQGGSMSRTTIGDMPMGTITLSPPEQELVRQLVAEALRKAAGGRTLSVEWPKIYCGIKTFDVSTPATALYWDVTARIVLILRVRGADRQLSGEAVERTYLWPSEEVIGRVTTQALQQVSAAVDQELPALLTLPH